ncbi:MAG: hypothetical protein WKF77_32160 [Planctomycetaceae bacterium]
MADSDALPDEDSELDDLQFPEGDYAVEDIELAYRQALEALDAAERQVGSVMVDMVEPANAPVSRRIQSLMDFLSVRN